jgi:spore coat protein JB
MKIDRDRLDMLKEIMALDFSSIELNLYLDTHPMDKRALAIYNDYIMKAKKLREEYEMKYAFLTPMHMSDAPWRWIEGPWPWEINYEMGGK